jgi:hypothetical protein
MMERGKISEILDTTLIISIPDDGERKNLRNFRHNTHHINP